MNSAESNRCPIVVKVGGSLYDLPDLGLRLRRWLDELATRAILLVPGGGALADVVRALDRVHGLGEESAHWLALQALSLNARFLANLLGFEVVGWFDTSRIEEPLILDCHAFAVADEGEPGGLPHWWGVTSDSIAARVARLLNARRLVLLKSITIPEGTNWREAARRGWVDQYFAEAAAGDLEVRAINMRELSLAREPREGKQLD
jgi:aspartokinase-like uncharacterized kinase